VRESEERRRLAGLQQPGSLATGEQAVSEEPDQEEIRNRPDAMIEWFDRARRGRNEGHG
jgi:hypothetical protein